MQARYLKLNSVCEESSGVAVVGTLLAKSSVLLRRLKAESDGDEVGMCLCRVSQTRAAATGNAQPATVQRRVGGMTSVSDYNE